MRSTSAFPIFQFACKLLVRKHKMGAGKRRNGLNICITRETQGKGSLQYSNRVDYDQRDFKYYFLLGKHPTAARHLGAYRLWCLLTERGWSVQRRMTKLRLQDSQVLDYFNHNNQKQVFVQQFAFPRDSVCGSPGPTWIFSGTTLTHLEVRGPEPWVDRAQRNWQ